MLKALRSHSRMQRAGTRLTADILPTLLLLILLIVAMAVVGHLTSLPEKSAFLPRQAVFTAAVESTRN